MTKDQRKVIYIKRKIIVVICSVLIIVVVALFVFSLIFTIDMHPFFLKASMTFARFFKVMRFLGIFAIPPDFRKKQKSLKPCGFRLFTGPSGET